MKKSIACEICGGETNLIANTKKGEMRICAECYKSGFKGRKKTSITGQDGTVYRAGYID